jgi:hypothetical protein
VFALCEGRRDTGCELPVFQTGLGRSVAVKHSSIKKARAVLEDGDVKSGKEKHSYRLNCFLYYVIHTIH